MTFDRRHKWGEPIYENALMTRTCTVCGRIYQQEVIVPIAFVDELLRINAFRNPYRAAFREAR